MRLFADVRGDGDELRNALGGDYVLACVFGGLAVCAFLTWLGARLSRRIAR